MHFFQLCSQFQFYHLIDSLFPSFSKFRRPRCDNVGVDVQVSEIMQWASYNNVFYFEKYWKISENENDILLLITLKTGTLGGT